MTSFLTHIKLDRIIICVLCLLYFYVTIIIIANKNGDFTCEEVSKSFSAVESLNIIEGFQSNVLESNACFELSGEGNSEENFESSIIEEFEESIPPPESSSVMNPIELSDTVLIKKTPVHNIAGQTGLYVETRIYRYYAEQKDDYLGGLDIDDINTYFYDLSQLLSEANLYGVPVSAALAQAYTEGGAGKYGVYTVTNNLFGIMATPEWSGWVYGKENGRVYWSYKSAVYTGNKTIFKAYSDIHESIQDYLELVSTNIRYSKALFQSSYIYLSELVKNGYGEQHMYQVWMTIIEQYELEKYD